MSDYDIIGNKVKCD